MEKNDISEERSLFIENQRAAIDANRAIVNTHARGKIESELYQAAENKRYEALCMAIEDHTKHIEACDKCIAAYDRIIRLCDFIENHIITKSGGVLKTMGDRDEH
jgi:hypothetical protein